MTRRRNLWWLASSGFVVKIHAECADLPQNKKGTHPPPKPPPKKNNQKKHLSRHNKKISFFLFIGGAGVCLKRAAGGANFVDSDY